MRACIGGLFLKCTSRGIFPGEVFLRLTTPLYARARQVGAVKAPLILLELQQNKWPFTPDRVLGDYVAVGARTQCAHNARNCALRDIVVRRRGVVRLGGGLLRRPPLDSANRRTYREVVDRPYVAIWGPKVCKHQQVAEV